MESLHEILLSKHSKKSILLNLTKALVDKSEQQIKDKNEELIKEKQLLDELHDDIFKMENEFCNSIWRFSHQHKFPQVINQYLDMVMKSPSSFSSSNYQDKMTSLNNKLTKFTNDINSIQMELEQRIKTIELKVEQNEIVKYNRNQLKENVNNENKIHQSSSSTKTSKFKVKTKSEIYKKFEKLNKH